MKYLKVAWKFIVVLIACFNLVMALYYAPAITMYYHNNDYAPFFSADCIYILTSLTIGGCFLVWAFNRLPPEFARCIRKILNHNIYPSGSEKEEGIKEVK